MVQAWNSFPTYYTWGEKPESTLTHKDLNHGSSEEMPWNLELVAVPESKDKPAHDHANMERGRLTRRAIARYRLTTLFLKQK